jgi:hypothetical protein
LSDFDTLLVGEFFDFDVVGLDFRADRNLNFGLVAARLRSVADHDRHSQNKVRKSPR